MTALELTAYRSFGEVTIDSLINALADELSSEVDNTFIDAYNKYLASIGCTEYYNVLDFDEIMECIAPFDIVRMVRFGSFTIGDEYFTFDDYNNLLSISEYRLIEEIRKDRDFLVYYVKHNKLINDAEANALIEESNRLIQAGM